MIQKYYGMYFYTTVSVKPDLGYARFYVGNNLLCNLFVHIEKASIDPIKIPLLDSCQVSELLLAPTFKNLQKELTV